MNHMITLETKICECQECRRKYPEFFKMVDNQPERSKREELPKLVYLPPEESQMSSVIRWKYNHAKAICGALNTVETS